MGKRGKPKRIIRCGKPKACPECGHKKLLEVIYGMPSEEVVDNISEYDIRGCCMGPFREVKIKDKSGNFYICQVPKANWVCSNKDCRLEVYWRKDCELASPKDHAYNFYGNQWQTTDFENQNEKFLKLRSKVHRKFRS